MVRWFLVLGLVFGSACAHAPAKVEAPAPATARRTAGDTPAYFLEPLLLRHDDHIVQTDPLLHIHGPVCGHVSRRRDERVTEYFVDGCWQRPDSRRGCR